MNKLKQLWKSITELPLLRELLAWTKRYSLPGFAGVPIYNIVVFVYNETLKDNITTRANSIAFSLFIALFPFVIFLFTLIPYLDSLIPMGNPIEVLRENLETILPNNANNYLLNMRLVAFNLTILLGLLFILSFILLIIGPTILHYLDSKFDLGQGWLFVIKLLRYFIGILMVYVGITLIYRYGPSMHRRIPFVNAGAMLATLLSIITSVGFSYFVNNFGRYNELYGSIGALIVLMLWLQFNAFVILIGYELDASIAVNRDLLLEETNEPDSFLTSH